MRNKRKNTFFKNVLENFRTENSAPMYTTSGDIIYTQKKLNLKWLAIVLPIAAVIGVIAGIIYLPQFFIPDTRESNLIADTNPAAHTEMLQYVKTYSGEDFDKDGLSNFEELEAKTDPFFNDTDKDGVLDGYDQTPLKKNDTLYNSILSTGASIKTPYEINGVILWPDNKETWTYGAVIPVRNGYQFTGFSGWAKFPGGKYAYQYIDGRHTLLKHNEKANTWKIERDCVVVLTDKQPENTYLISFFGNETFMRNGFGKFLSWLLPEKGWITAKTMWLDDTFVDTSNNTFAPYQKVGPSAYDATRYGQYSKSLTDLAEVYDLIDNGYCVLASLMSEQYGETIVEVYGYTNAGNLIVADPQIKSINGIITIDACCSRALTFSGELTENAWFEYYGCGYDSHKGDMIAFFSTINNKGELE